MAQILSLPPCPGPAIPSYKSKIRSARRILAAPASSAHSWTSLLDSVKCKGRFSCLFSDNRRQEEARKALESALSGKKIEFEKWDEVLG